jgi:hypothetical protein
MYYFLVQAFKWMFDVDSKVITYKRFTFKVTAVFGHHVANIHMLHVYHVKQYFGAAVP